MQASLEQMQAANEEHRQKQQDAEARLATLKVMLVTSVRYCSLACHAVCGALQVSVCCRGAMQSLCRHDQIEMALIALCSKAGLYHQ